MILRTYACPECNYLMQVTLTSEQWDQPPPSCEMCDRRTDQVFSPPAIGGSVGARARAIAEDIAANDYNVANVNFEHRQGGAPKVRYKDQSTVSPSSWQAHTQMLEQAISICKQNRRDFGLDGLDILKRNLAGGEQVDLIEASKKRALEVW